MGGAVLSFPYMGILAILLKTMTLEADALTAWDCSRDGLKSRTVYLKDLSEGEKVFLESMRMYLGVEYPDEFAYKIKRVPGYTAIIEEDKFHIIQCEPVVALLLPQDKCYDRLQIVYHDNIYFLTPWTHIITETANEIPCNAPNLRDYELEGSTYKILSRPGVSLEPRRDKNFEEDPVNSSPKLTPKETEYRRRRNIGGIDTVSKEPIESYMYRLEHPELDLEPRRDKNFEEDPENSSPKLTLKYKETEYRRRRNIGEIDTVSKESIQSYIYRLKHPELDLEPKRDNNFEEDPENSSPKLTPKYKETEYQRRRNIGGIDTVSTESIQSYMYRLEHPELDQEPRKDKNFEEDPENSSPKLTPKETEYRRRRNIGGIDTVSTESIQSYMYRLEHPELDQEPRRDKNFEEDPENSSPKLTPKYKETEYQRRRNIGGIDTVSTESIQSYMYRLEHPELDQEPRRDKNFEEDPENSSPKLTPKYKETEYQRRRNIGGIDTVSTESIQSYMYRLEHPELDQEPRRDKNFEEEPENSSPKLTPKYKETEYQRRRNIGGIDTVSTESIQSYMYRLEHPELDQEPRKDKNFEEDPENSSPKLTPKYKETEYQRRRNIGGIDTVSTESIQSYMYRLEHPELDQEPRKDKNFEEDPENSSPKLTPKYKETEYQRRRNIGGIDTVSTESIQSYMYRLEHPELDQEPRRDKNFEEEPENSSPKLTPKYKETEYQRRRNIGGIDTVSTESIQSYMYRLEHPELDQEPRKDKNFEEDPESSSPKLTPKYKETEYQRRRNIGGIDTVSTESIQSYMYRLEHPELDQEPRKDKNFEEDPENSSPKLTPKETEYRRRRNIGGIDTVSKEPIESYMYRLEHPELDLEPRRDKNFEEDPENSSPKLTLKYKETEYQRRRNIGEIDTVSKESIQSYIYRLEHPELDLEPRRDKNFEEDPENSSPKLTPKYKETEYQRRRNIGGIDTVSKESIQSYMYRLEHPELDGWGQNSTKKP